MLTEIPSQERLSQIWDSLSPEQKQPFMDEVMLLWALEKVERVDNRKFSFENHPFLREIYLDNSRRRVVMKSTQLGLTIEEILHSFHQTNKGLNWGYFFPTDQLVTRFVQGRYDTLIGNNPKLKALIADTDSTAMKKIGKGIIYFLGLGAATKDAGKFNTISIPLDGETFDEVEKMQPIKVQVALQRMEASPYKFENYISTPGIPDYGIDAIYQKSDQKVWFMTCQHCGHKWCVEDELLGMKMDEIPRCIRRGYLACPGCEQQQDGRNGEWQATRPENKKYSGYHVSKLYFPLAEIPDLLDKYESAIGNPSEMSIVWTEDLGLPYVDISQKLNREMVLRLCTGNTMLSRSDRCFMGIDIGGSKKGCHCVILKPHPVKMFEIVWMGVIQPEAIPGLRTTYGVRKFGIDAAPEDHLARQVERENRGKCWRVRYNDSQKKGYQWLDEEHEVQVHRTSSLDAAISLIRKGEILLPRRNAVVEEFADHLSAVTKTLETDPDTGKKEYYYKLTGRASDFLHALNYALIQCYDGTKKIGSDFKAQMRVPDNIRDLMNS